MKVIFVQDLKKVAKKGDIKEVKDGYAENFLIKNKYAVKYTDNNIKNYNNEKKKEAEIDNNFRDEALNLKKELENTKLVFKVKTGEQDRVFGSISSKQIKEELSKKGYKIDKKQLSSIEPLQSLGFHKVEINLYKDIKAELKVELTK